MDLGYFVDLMGSTVWTEPSCHSGAEDPGAAILALKTLELPFWRCGFGRPLDLFIMFEPKSYLYLPIPSYT